MNHRRFALLILLLFSAPNVEASSLQADMTAEAVELRGVTGEAPLLSLKFLANNGTAAPRFELEAESLRLELDQTERSVVVGSERIDYFVSTNSSHHQDATLLSNQPGNGFRWALDAQPGLEAPTLHASPACLRVEPAPRSTEITQPVVDQANRAPRSTDVGDALRVRPCAETLLTIEGDFMVSVWDWNLRIQDQGSWQDIITGVHPRSDGIGDQATDAYLFASNARLTLTIDSDPAAFYLDTARFTTDSARLHGAHGLLRLDGHELSLSDDDLDLHGNLELNVQGNQPNAPLRVDVTGETSSVSGTLDPLTVQVPTSPVPTYAWTLLATASILGLAAWLYAQPLRVYHQHRLAGDLARRRPPSNHWQKRAMGKILMAKQALDQGRLRRALQRAKEPDRSHPMHADALLVQAHAHLLQAENSTGRTREVQLEHVHTRLLAAGPYTKEADESVAYLACLMAHLELLYGNNLAAQKLLVEAHGIDPLFAQRYMRRGPFQGYFEWKADPIGSKANTDDLSFA